MNGTRTLVVVVLLLLGSIDGRLSRMSLAVALALMVAALVGRLPVRPFAGSAVRSEYLAGGTATAGGCRTLFVLVPGMAPKRHEDDVLADRLRRHGDVLYLDYPASAVSNADPKAVAAGIADRVDAASRLNRDPTAVVLVANSMGAPLARRALLTARDRPWAKQVGRIVLVAGLSRGWDLARPARPGALDLVGLRLLAWLGRLLGWGRLAFSFERGAPFVDEMRRDWMDWQGSVADGARIEIVHVLGDRDILIGADEDEDLRAAAAGGHALVRLAETGHDNSLDFGCGACRTDADRRRGRYRLDTIELAATGTLDRIRALPSEARAPTMSTRLTTERSMGPTSTSRPAEIDHVAAKRLLDALERDLDGIGSDAAGVAVLRAEIAELRRVLHADEPSHESMRTGFAGMRERLHELQQELKGDAFQAGRYLAEIGRVLGL
jgi:hypothetical protein